MGEKEGGGGGEREMGLEVGTADGETEFTSASIGLTSNQAQKGLHTPKSVVVNSLYTDCTCVEIVSTSGY